MSEPAQAAAGDREIAGDRKIAGDREMTDPFAAAATRYDFAQLQPSAPPDPDAATRLLALAEAKAEQIRGQAHAEGFAAGHAEGVNDGLAAVQAAANALQAAANGILATREEMASGLEHDAVELALAVASKILSGTLEVQPERVLDVIRGALRHIADRRRIAVLVDPEDLEVVTAAIEQVSAQAGGIELCEVQAERRVGRGGAIVRTAEGEVDACVGTQLERAREVIVAELSGAGA